MAPGMDVRFPGFLFRESKGVFGISREFIFPLWCPTLLLSLSLVFLWRKPRLKPRGIPVAAEGEATQNA
jgi:hypothetical protein